MQQALKGLIYHTGKPSSSTKLSGFLNIASSLLGEGFRTGCQENIERMEIDFTSEWNEEDSVESCKFVCVCVSA